MHPFIACKQDLFIAAYFKNQAGLRRLVALKIVAVMPYKNGNCIFSFLQIAAYINFIIYFIMLKISVLITSRSRSVYKQSIISVTGNTAHGVFFFGIKYGKEFSVFIPAFLVMKPYPLGTFKYLHNKTPRIVIPLKLSAFADTAL